MPEDNHALAWFVRTHDLDEIFWHLADTSGGDDSCWLWRGRRTVGGYGRVVKAGVLHAAHRLSLTIHGIEIPTGFHVDHLCHNADPTCTGSGGCDHRRCVNPRHLEPVPERVNILRGKGPGAAAARRTHCPAGHELAGANLLNSASSYRICRTCKREKQAAVRYVKASAARAGLVDTPA